MSLQQELSSWFASRRPALTVSDPPAIGQKAPQTPNLPLETEHPTVLVFLRHTGCPFAEKTLINLREVARHHKDITFLAISHSSQEATDTWLKSLPQAGSEPSNLQIIVDEKVEAYAAWGLGSSSYAHVLSPSALYAVWRLGNEEGIWNRPCESGSRWQMSGFFAIDQDGVMTYPPLLKLSTQ
ncbi:hypothetical protein LTR86_008869 [Recurvomyces mirabilis]|nr:hypothetical protein LTR86_008869 [Recurvomyces mirabilis]